MYTSKHSFLNFCYCYYNSDYLVSEAKDKKQMVYDVSDWSLECCKVPKYITNNYY